MSATTLPLIINGKETTTSTTFDVVSPSTGETVWKCSSASKKDAIDAVEAAAAAFPPWSKSKPTYRRAIILRAADLLEKKASEFHEAMAKETGSAHPFCKFNTDNATEMLRDVAGRIVSALGGEMPVCQQEGTNALVFKEPYGVVLGIAPWNAPYVLGLRSFLYALAAGNTVIFKGSELSPRCFYLLGNIFTEAGLPAGVLNVLYHRTQDAAEVTSALIEHSAVKKINFTGSTATGRIIATNAGKNLKPVLLELGGKASSIVCADADIGKAAKECTLGAFLHSGQICMSTERILVHASILKPFREALQSTISAIFPAKEPAVLVQSASVNKNRRLIEDALSKGASVVHGDHRKEESSKTRMAPVVIEGVKEGMDLFHTESFGPSVSLISFETEEEAVKLANDTEYGLSGAVFTENLGTGLRIAKQIESGAVHINSMSVHDEPNLPHGGVKNSGFGRFNSRWGLEEFLRTKTVTFQD
ncbi:salicylaldehyde dehydrogenase [Tothia fuscella]|uniref:Salicylaldehyde dehydrogenase n=1 Tax=Tothia fuscella TaxID=1048955 RepID=A0A9P4NF37_9PEZI|nr:salicylaldehyde dehydrogenase [Tothia fuscella]